MSDRPALRDLPSLARWGDELRQATARAAETRPRRRRTLAVGLATVVAVAALAVEIGRSITPT